MGKETKEAEMTLDEDGMLELLAEANAVQRGKGGKIVIAGRTWRVRATSQRQNLKMLNLDYDVLCWQKELKEARISRRRVKRLNAKIRKAYAKKAAYRVVGRWLWLIPFFYALTWWRIYNSPEEVSATLNDERLSPDANFYSANLASSRRALVLSTMQVGNAVKQLREREASAESMLDGDALPKKEEDSK